MTQQELDNLQIGTVIINNTHKFTGIIKGHLKNDLIEVALDKDYTGNDGRIWYKGHTWYAFTSELLEIYSIVRKSIQIKSRINQIEL